MAPLLIKSIRLEYETTDITLKDLNIKYDLQEVDTSEWQKEKPAAIVPAFLDNKDAPPVKAGEVVAFAVDKQKMLEDIDGFKNDIIEYAREAMRDSDVLEIKEVKDLVAMVSSVEISLKDAKDTGPTVNILINNIQEKFKDDC